MVLSMFVSPVCVVAAYFNARSCITPSRFLFSVTLVSVRMERFGQLANGRNYD